MVAAFVFVFFPLPSSGDLDIVCMEQCPQRHIILLGTWQQKLTGVLIPPHSVQNEQTFVESRESVCSKNVYWKDVYEKLASVFQRHCGIPLYFFDRNVQVFLSAIIFQVSSIGLCYCSLGLRKYAHHSRNNYYNYPHVVKTSKGSKCVDAEQQKAKCPVISDAL